MYLYWRVQTDFDEIGSLMVLRHPSMSREFEKWVRRNAGGLAIAQGLTWSTLQPLCLSPN
jgi:hypothetical protein